MYQYVMKRHVSQQSDYLNDYIYIVDQSYMHMIYMIYVVSVQLLYLTASTRVCLHALCLSDGIGRS